MKAQLIVEIKEYKKSNSEFIAFMDSDDFWPPDKLEKQINYMKKKD